MDLGIAGRRAIVCASSRGLGRACALALAAEGVSVTVSGREADAVARTVDEIAALKRGAAVPVVGDVNTPEGRAALLAAMPNPDILITNTGGPPLGHFRDWDAEVWHRALNDLMVSPILLVRAVIEGMQQRRFGRVVAITSAAVKMPPVDRGLTSGPKAGLSGFLAGLSRGVAKDNVTINMLLPGFFATERGNQAIDQRAERAGEDKAAFRARILSGVPVGRMGDPAEFGATCAFLCGAQSGFLTGQSILIDGGRFPGNQ
jgi:3-oxoacyl-[acyl-carrier protein] reductase